MDNQQQPTQPDPETKPTTPPANESVFESPGPKKDKKKIITKIIVGVIALGLIVAVVLVYFLWWQNPQKMVTDATVKAINAKQIAVNGQMTVKIDETDLTMDITTKGDGKNGSANVAMRLKPKGFEGELEMMFDGVYSEDGVLYAKANNFGELIDKALDTYIKSEAEKYDISAKEVEETKDMIKKSFEPIVEKTDGKWLKLEASDFKDDKTTQCVLDTVKEANSNDQLVQEIADIYQKNNFAIIKQSIESKDGAKGFEIDLSSQEARDKIRDFKKEAEGTELAKKLKECETDKDDSDDEITDKDTTGTLKVWVDPWKHQFTRIELKLKNDKDKAEVNLSYDLDFDKTEAVEVPSQADSLVEVFKEFDGMFR